MSTEGEQTPKKKSSPKATYVSPIAKPMAGKTLSKKIYKINQKASKEKALRRGVKEVVKAIKKKETGLCVIAGDISPIDVITHLPVLCEDANVPYVYVAGKEQLGASAGCKRPTSCVLINLKSNTKLKAKLDKTIEEVRELPAPVAVNISSS